jgi:hypothetical protein
MLRADGWHIVGSSAPWEWWLDGHPGGFVSASFETLARRGASELTRVGTIDLLTVWLEALRQDGSGFRVTGSSSELPIGGGKRLDRQTGSILRLCETSATFCKKLESAALQSEFEKKQRNERQISLSAPSAPLVEPKAETIAEQLNRLREECQLSPDELVEQLSIQIDVTIDVRTVRRHLSGNSVPYPRNLWAYQRLFSKLLNRKIVISKMS